MKVKIVEKPNPKELVEKAKTGIIYLKSGLSFNLAEGCEVSLSRGNEGTVDFLIHDKLQGKIVLLSDKDIEAIYLDVEANTRAEES
ncbi:MAG: hypothetical protein HY226_00785 [Candidatus Vogelbacteria bacterium]|nr:hypothetical protein [Candidatus Vogelbacteria bacterium]